MTNPGAFHSRHRYGVTVHAFRYAVHPAPDWVRSVLVPDTRGATLAGFGRVRYGDWIVNDGERIVAMDEEMFGVLFGDTP